MIVTLKTSFKDVIRDASRSLNVVRPSEFNHRLSLSLLADKIGNKHFAKRQNIRFIENPFVFKFPMRILKTLSAVQKTAKGFMKPIHQSLISIHDQYSAIKASFLRCVSTNVKCSFSINNSCKIANMFNVPHVPTPVFSLRLTQEGINSNHPQRLTPRTPVMVK